MPVLTPHVCVWCVNGGRTCRRCLGSDIRFCDVGTGMEPELVSGILLEDTERPDGGADGLEECGAGTGIDRMRGSPSCLGAVLVRLGI